MSTCLSRWMKFKILIEQRFILDFRKRESKASINKGTNKGDEIPDFPYDRVVELRDLGQMKEDLHAHLLTIACSGNDQRDR